MRASLFLIGFSLAVPTLPAQSSFRFEYNRNNTVVDRCQHDLTRAYEHAQDRGHIERAQRRLGNFQAQRASGLYAGHELDSAIGALHKVVKSNGIDPRDRDVLGRDLADLRVYRTKNGF